ncbi:MAG: hypothetical protein LBD45_05940 [Bacteroidales bacterium]|jgi:hypothetical protein|nr:hypothetical protein [Bacteroidales bacterium]
MKSIFIVVMLAIFALPMFGQSSKYKEARAYLLNEGYSISTEQYADLAQGETAGHTKTFYKNSEYFIFAISDDSDVTDVDIYLNDASGSIYTKDTDTSNVAVVTFSPSFTREMRVVMKNYASNTPSYKSRCRILIAYK